MASPKIAIGISTLLASLMLVSLAAAETVVPPGNGAATQYTEALPTSGGNTVSGNGVKGGGGGHSTPSKVLGHHNAKKLEGAGKVGKEVAYAAAETAPANVSAGSAPAAAGSAVTGSGSSGGASHQGGGSSHQPTSAPSGSGSSTSGSESPAADKGSSGLGEVVGQATGSSSGESGLLLPLILLAALLGSIAFVWRRRRHPAH